MLQGHGANVIGLLKTLVKESYVYKMLLKTLVKSYVFLATTCLKQNLIYVYKIFKWETKFFDKFTIML